VTRFPATLPRASRGMFSARTRALAWVNIVEILYCRYAPVPASLNLGGEEVRRSNAISLRSARLSPDISCHT
jgi:hypothetical protein